VITGVRADAWEKKPEDPPELVEEVRPEGRGRERADRTQSGRSDVESRKRRGPLQVSVTRSSNAGSLTEYMLVRGL